MGIQASPSDSADVTQSWKVPLNDLSQSWLASPEAQEVLCKVAASGVYSLGPQVAAFEKEFADYLGVSEVVGVASGTDALEIALRTVGCERGDTIVSVANAGGYTSIAAAQIGARVRYCDVDPYSLLMNAETLYEVLSPEVKAVVVTHLYGNVVDMDPIVDICKSIGIPVIEDCAQAAGATYKGKRVGSLGDIAAFSFYPTKNLGCMGDGGAIVTSNRQYASLARQLRQYGWSTRYHIQISGGRNSRLDEVQAAVLRHGLKALDEQNAARREIQRTYNDALAGTEYRLVATSPLTESVAHLSVVLAQDPNSRSRMYDRLTSKQIQTGVHYPISDQDQIGLRQSFNSKGLLVTTSACRRILTIPTFPSMSPEEIQHVALSLALPEHSQQNAGPIKK